MTYAWDKKEPEKPAIHGVPERRQPQITVGELIALLQKHEPDMKVTVEGCDCVGDAVGVRREPADHHGEWVLLIERNP